MSVLLALAERCEKAVGADRELDRAIWLAAVAGPADVRAYSDGLAISQQEASFRADYLMDGRSYTASLDAAVTLFPGDAFWRVGHDGEGADPSLFRGQVLAPPTGIGAVAVAETPALALCAAALKVRSRATGAGSLAMTPAPLTSEATSEVPKSVERRRGGWFVTGLEWSGPWATQRAAELARGGEYDLAHAEERHAATRGREESA